MKRTILLALGWVCVGLGVTGSFVPILPTTPFLLLAAYLFAGQSAKCEAWLVSSRLYKRYALPYKEQGGLTIKKKAEILFTAFVFMALSGAIVNSIHVRIFLFLLALIMLLVFVRIPTIKQGRFEQDQVS